MHLRDAGIAMRPLIVTPGDPVGIGPEITVKMLAEERPGNQPIVVAGSLKAMQAAMKCCRIRLPLVPVGALEDPIPTAGIPIWDPGGRGEPVEVAAIRGAVRACQSGHAAGLVTGPIHKFRLSEQGFQFPGHTGFLGHLCDVDSPVMAFAGGQLRVALVTVHVPLRAVADALTQERVLQTIRVAERALRHDLGILTPKIGVCGLNPHAGDGGLLGSEERDIIAPAIQQAVREGLDVQGPLSAEAAMRLGVDGTYDLIVAMYHDQGLAPLKLIDFGRSVNWTLGLPIVRTSVDHGTADDIVGKGVADASSLQAAVELASTIVQRRASGA